MTQANEDNDKDLLNYLIEATEKSFLYWTQVEPNHNPTIINEIKTFIEKKQMKTIKEWDQIIKEEAITRLFKNNNIPQNYLKLKDLKHPNLIEALSNAPTHIIKELIIKHIKSRKEPQTFILHSEKYIKPYILLCLLENDEAPKIKKPEDRDNLNDIIEYQQLYDLYIIDKVNKIEQNINEKTKEVIKQINEDNQIKKEEAKIGTLLSQSIEWVRENIPNWKRKKLDYAESLIERIKLIQKQNINQTEYVKKKPGRPKKNKNTEDNQPKIDNYMDIDQK